MQQEKGMDLISKLKQFYMGRKEKLSHFNFENVDWTDVFDPYLDEKIENPIMIIGEAPGLNEVIQKQPFVGMAGKNLDYLISLSKYDRKRDILITNAFPFRTFEGNKNRTQKAKELKEGAKLLIQEIKIVQPKMILLLGNSSIKAFSCIAQEVKHFEKNSINKIKVEVVDTKIGISYHPSPISFNRKEIRKNLEEFFTQL